MVDLLEALMMERDYKFNISRYLNGNNSGRNFSEIL